MTESQIADLSTRVLWAAFALGVVFGVVAQRTRFCTMGAVADVATMGDWTRARMWALAIAVAMLGFNTMVALGWIEARSSIYAGTSLTWLSAILGGALFGFGMVIASGCGSRNLVRLGGGNLKSLVVLLVLGIAAFATMRGFAAVWRVRGFDTVALALPRGQDLPTLLSAPLGMGVPVLAAAIGGTLALAIVAWVLARPEGRSGPVWLGGVGIGGVVAAVWWVSGRYGFVPEDPTTLEPAFLATNSRRMESLSMVAPVGFALDWLMYTSDASKRLSLGIASLLGIVAGAFVASRADRSFRWEAFGGVSDLAHHLAGAVLMGFGGVLALGCTVGQGLSGISTLALGSFLALGAIIGGALLGLRYQEWRLEREN